MAFHVRRTQLSSSSGKRCRRHNIPWPAMSFPLPIPLSFVPKLTTPRATTTPNRAWSGEDEKTNDTMTNDAHCLSRKASRNQCLNGWGWPERSANQRQCCRPLIKSFSRGITSPEVYGAGSVKARGSNTVQISSRDFRRSTRIFPSKGGNCMALTLLLLNVPCVMNWGIECVRAYQQVNVNDTEWKK